jgi:hypothetical protein
MTHAELYEIVKDVPKEAWPEGLAYIRDEWWVYGPPSGEYVAPSLAEEAFLGSMTRYLINNTARESSPHHGEEVRMVIDTDGATPTVAVDIGGCNWYHGATDIEALAAACKEIA